MLACQGSYDGDVGSSCVDDDFMGQVTTGH